MSDKSFDTIFGIHPVKVALLKKPHSIKNILAVKSGSVKKIQPIKNLAKKHGVRMDWIDPKQVPSDLLSANHQGVIAFLKQSEQQSFQGSNEDDLITMLKEQDRSALILALDSVQDPHNLGACLRVADGAGVDAVILPKDASSPVTSVVRKVACGAVETVNLYYVTNLSRTLQKLKKLDFWITGTTGEANQFYDEIDYRGKTVLVMGNEGSGMRQKITENCDYLVKIPMLGEVESLNVSVASGIMLYEAIRQRKS